MSIRSKRQTMRKLSALAVTAMFASLLALATPAGAQTPVSPTTNRIHGADRYATAVAMARSINSVSDGLIIASGESSADALAAATVATADRPVLLVPKDSIPESVSDFISDYKASLASAAAAKIYFVGGTEAISAANYTALVSLMTTAGDSTPPTFARLSGADRYATAAAIYAKAPATAAEKLIVVSGESWADGISAAALSAESGWPVVLQTKNGNNASAKATIDTYLALPASVKQFVLVGGEASLSTDTETYLINTKSVAIANIRRIHGADRYATSLNVNLYMDAQNIGGVDLVQVALASGESPWDALAASSWAAAKDSAVQLSPAAGGNASVSALGARVATLSKAGATTATESVGDTLYLLGGKTALSNAVRDGYRAGAANNLTSTLTGCADGSKTATLTLSGALSTTEAAGFITDGEGLETVLRLNAAAMAGGTTITQVSTSVYRINLAAALTVTNNVGDTLKFNGVTEDVAFSTDTFERSIATSSCTVVNDVTAPVVTMTGYAGTLDNDDPDAAGNPYWTLTSNEPIVLDAPAIGEMVCDGVANDRVMTRIATSALNANGVTGASTKWLIFHGGGAGAVEGGLVDAETAAGKVCTLAAAAMPDIGGVVPAAAVSTTQLAVDTTGPVATATGVTCVNTTDQTDLTQGNLTISATSTGAYTGATGNSWKMTVVQSRGLLQPTISVDAATKMITVTGDTGYHTANDVAARWASMNLGSDWAVTANAGLITATVTPATSIAGQSTCTLKVDLNEPGTIGTGANISVAGLDAGYVGDPSCTTGFDSTACVAYAAADIDAEMSTNLSFSFTTKAVGVGSMSLAAGAQGLTNPSADVGVTPVTFTVPG